MDAREYSTTIGTVVLKTDWAPLVHFFDMQSLPLGASDHREVEVMVDVVPASEIELASGKDLDPDAYPRVVHIEGCAFMLWRDHIYGKVAKDTVHAGLVIEWLWYALAVCCAPEGWEAIHAAAVERAGKVALLLGPSGSGKTRMAKRMMADGWRFFSDDIVLVNRTCGWARAWGSTMHVDPREAGSNLTIDFCGKVRVRPPAKQLLVEAVIGECYAAASTMPADCKHEGAGFDSEWVNSYGACEFLLGMSRPFQVVHLDPLRIALVNRNFNTHPWWGGDMTNLFGYAHGLRVLGHTAEYVPWDELDEAQWDIVHLFHAQYDWSENIARTITKPFVVQTITNMPNATERGALAAHMAKALILYSEEEGAWYAEHHGVADDKMVVCPQGVPSDIYQIPAVAPEPRVFMSTRYIPDKNLHLVVDACGNLGLGLSIAGMVDGGVSGGYATKLMDIVRRRNLPVRLYGQLGGRELWREYQRCHVHVQCSRWEAFGLSTWEAMAAGCNAVVGSHGFGVSVFAPHATVVEPSVDAIERAIKYEMEQPRGRHGFRPPTWEDAAQALIPVYAKALRISGI